MPTAEDIIHHLLDQIDPREWDVTPAVNGACEIWPPMVSQLAPAVARVPLKQYPDGFEIEVYEAFGLHLYGPVNRDGWIYFLTAKMIEKLPGLMVS